jgi:hypothetical protein
VPEALGNDVDDFTVRAIKPVTQESGLVIGFIHNDSAIDHKEDPAWCGSSVMWPIGLAGEGKDRYIDGRGLSRSCRQCQGFGPRGRPIITARHKLSDSLLPRKRLISIETSEEFTELSGR